MFNININIPNKYDIPFDTKYYIRPYYSQHSRISWDRIKRTNTRTFALPKPYHHFSTCNPQHKCNFSTSMYNTYTFIVFNYLLILAGHDGGSAVPCLLPENTTHRRCRSRTQNTHVLSVAFVAVCVGGACGCVCANAHIVV